ncbi:hypothetical protein PV04_02556 [Phialophora macrospora]|uniref:Zn(2)-C6 fungal-type domain-containing protein n=1 Tax=Phialophora macrospora TaxID=1851006 RepID=A0A0D2E7H1_9EURO|nr:hypothetical protein PV04_02556 [Phialophora macrospora]
MQGSCRRACEACRARKSRCLPGSREGVCRRCERSGLICVHHEAVRKTAPLKRIHGRFAPNTPPVREDSQGTTTALGHAHSNNVPRPSDATSFPEQERNESTSQKDEAAFGQALLVELGIGAIDQWPACKGLKLQRAKTFLDQYIQMAHAVPFAIQLPSGNSTGAGTATTDTDGLLGHLLISCPVFLLTAILTGSSSDREFEKQADNLFRHVLADRVIVKGQTSLELLQSLLTYLAWYHHRFEPETLQVYQFVQLANGMVADLGLPRKFSRAGVNSAQQEADPDEIRAFLLCYYLNCGGGVLGYDRSENMQCIESLRNAAKILAVISPRSQDKEAPALVELLHLVARHHSANSMSNCAATPPPASGPSLLKDWATTFLHPQTSATLRSSFHFTTAYSLLKSSSAEFPSSAEVQVCVHHFQELLSNILAQDLAYLVHMGIVEWAHLITTLFLLARLGLLATAATGGSVRAWPVHEYIARFRSLRESLRQASETEPGRVITTTFSAPHLLGWLDRILVAVSERASSVKAPREVSSTDIGHQGSAYELVNSFLENGNPALSKTRAHRTPATPNVVPKINGEDFWSEFMSDWLNW